MGSASRVLGCFTQLMMRSPALARRSAKLLPVQNLHHWIERGVWTSTTTHGNFRPGSPPPPRGRGRSTGHVESCTTGIDVEHASTLLGTRRSLRRATCMRWAVILAQLGRDKGRVAPLSIIFLHSVIFRLRRGTRPRLPRGTRPSGRGTRPGGTRPKVH